MNKFKDLKVDDKEFGKIEAIICSMTKKEKQNTKLLNASRRQRIAKGSGTRILKRTSHITCVVEER